MFDRPRVYKAFTGSKTIFLLCLAVFIAGVGYTTSQLPFLRWLPMNYYTQLIGIAASVSFVYLILRVELPTLIVSQLSLIGKYTLIIYLAQGIWLPFWIPFEGWNNSLLIFLACFGISVPVAYLCVWFAKIMEFHPLTKRLILGQFPSGRNSKASEETARGNEARENSGIPA